MTVYRFSLLCCIVLSLIVAMRLRNNLPKPNLLLCASSGSLLLRCISLPGHCGTAGRREKPTRMEVLPNLGTDQHPRTTEKLFKTPTTPWRPYQAKPQGRAGRGSSKRYMNLSPKITAVTTGTGECKHSLEANKILEFLKRNNASPFEKVEIKAS